MADEVGIALVGLGSVSQRGLLPHLVQEDLAGRCRLTAVCDTAPGRAGATAEKLGIPQAFEDYGRLLAEADVDIRLWADMCQPSIRHALDKRRSVSRSRNIDRGPSDLLDLHDIIPVDPSTGQFERLDTFVHVDIRLPLENWQMS